MRRSQLEIQYGNMLPEHPAPISFKKEAIKSTPQSRVVEFLVAFGVRQRGQGAWTIRPSTFIHLSSRLPACRFAVDVTRADAPSRPGGSRDYVVASVLAGGPFAFATSKSRHKNVRQMPAEPIQRAQRQVPSKSLCSCCFWSHFTRHSVGSGPQIASADAAREGDESWFWCWPGSLAHWLGPLARAR